MTNNERSLLLDLKTDAKVATGKIRLKVVDERGKPVIGAVIGTDAYLSEHPKKAKAKPSMVFYLLASKKAKLTGKSDTVLLKNDDLFWEGTPKDRPQSLVVMHEGRQIGAVRTVCPHAKGRSGTLTLLPLCRVSGKLTSSKLAKLGRKLSWANTTVLTGELRPMSRSGSRCR